MSSEKRSIWPRRLDELPPTWAITLGVALGIVAGFVLAVPSIPWVMVIGFVALFVVGAALAASGEPVAILVGSSARLEPEIVEKTPAVEAEVVEEEDEVFDPLALVEIPGGTFWMGSPEDEEGRLKREGQLHEVTLTGFRCMRYPVTRQLYAEVMGEDPGWPGANEGEAEEFARLPVNHVSWLDAVRFCIGLSRRQGLEPPYTFDEEGNVSCYRSANGYRLPTEAEWEYACRAGTGTRWSFGDDEALLGEYAWFGGISGNRPHPVGEKEANPWGLHDMHGNVWEWVNDWYRDPYPEEAQVDPQGPTEEEATVRMIGADEKLARVLRGGSFANGPRDLRSANRVRNRPSNRIRDNGFRCVLPPPREL